MLLRASLLAFAIAVAAPALGCQSDDVATCTVGGSCPCAQTPDECPFGCLSGMTDAGQFFCANPPTEDASYYGDDGSLTYPPDDAYPEDAGYFITVPDDDGPVE
jgi:hypothetical protein